MATATSATSATNSMSALQDTMNPKKAATDSVQAETDKFMTLLVTQLKNQDPLNPMDNAAVTSQMAQLSTVSGINKLNDTLSTLKTSYQNAENIQATSLIGHSVLIEGNGVKLSGGVGAFGVELTTPADSVQIVISDATGKDVESIDLGAQKEGIVPVAWDGIPDANKLDANGKPVRLADGNYTFKVVAMRSGTKLDDVKGLTVDSVGSVTTSATNGVKLNLTGKGAAITMADIKQVL